MPPVEADPAQKLQSYTHPDKLVTTGWLAEHADDPGLVIVESDEDVLLYDTGHIPGAVNLDVDAPDFPEKIGKLDKNKTYLVHCAAGGRSAKACDRMSRLDFPKLYNLAGGFRAWEKAGNKPDK